MSKHDNPNDDGTNFFKAVLILAPFGILSLVILYGIAKWMNWIY